MSVKTLKLSLMLLSVVILTACSARPEIRYVTKTQDVYIPVKCVVPEVECDFNRTTYTGVVSAMMECIIEMKHNEEVCK